jgi:ABC-2 type transport system permease protein
VLDLSPFEHVPQLPAEPFTAQPLVALAAVAAALTAAGLAAFRRRDVPA